MSLLSWLFPKRHATAPVPPVARSHTASAAGRPDLSRLDPAAVRKVERSERREWVYSVVREGMLHAGILSARYKFKVLALDERGRRFLVMVDLARESSGDMAPLLRVEEHIVQTAKARYDLDVTAVYWRTNDQLDQGRAKAQAATRPAAETSAAPSARAETAAMPRSPGQPSGQMAKASGRYEPIQADEVEAFKRALAGERGPGVGRGEVVRSGPRSRAATDSGFQDTQMIEPDDQPDALGNTQYGDIR